jgi:hypothetical protein
MHGNFIIEEGPERINILDVVDRIEIKLKDIIR